VVAIQQGEDMKHTIYDWLEAITMIILIPVIGVVIMFMEVA